MKTNPLLALLRHHVTGKIERGEGAAIVEIPAVIPTKTTTILLKYITPKGDDALTVSIYGSFDLTSRNFSYMGKYGAGSGHPWEHVQATVRSMLRDHPRTKLSLSNLPAHLIP